ncbi:hypothetical protein SK128_010030 [Halocaridina rubra]|uniref:WAP domain-containing protein n=1 Tax=Halocaridina rubra TaxID=373956 RepID=A0AAN9ABX5_HALRR
MPRWVYISGMKDITHSRPGALPSIGLFWQRQKGSGKLSPIHGILQEMSSVMMLYWCWLVLMGIAHGAKLENLEREPGGWSSSYKGPIGSFFEAPLPSGGTHTAFAGFGDASQIQQGQNVHGSSFSSGQGTPAAGTYTAFAGFGAGSADHQAKGSFISTSGVPMGNSGSALQSSPSVSGIAAGTRGSSSVGSRFSSGTSGLRDSNLFGSGSSTTSPSSRLFSTSSGSQQYAGSRVGSLQQSSNSVSSGHSVSSNRGSGSSPQGESLLQTSARPASGFSSGSRFGSQGSSSAIGTSQSVGSRFPLLNSGTKSSTVISSEVSSPGSLETSGLRSPSLGSGNTAFTSSTQITSGSSIHSNSGNTQLSGSSVRSPSPGRGTFLKSPTLTGSISSPGRRIGTDESNSVRRGLSVSGSSFSSESSGISSISGARSPESSASASPSSGGRLPPSPVTTSALPGSSYISSSESRFGSNESSPGTRVSIAGGNSLSTDTSRTDDSSVIRGGSSTNERSSFSGLGSQSLESESSSSVGSLGPSSRFKPLSVSGNRVFSASIPGSQLQSGGLSPVKDTDVSPDSRIGLQIPGFESSRSSTGGNRVPFEPSRTSTSLATQRQKPSHGTFGSSGPRPIFINSRMPSTIGSPFRDGSQRTPSGDETPSLGDSRFSSQITRSEGSSVPVLGTTGLLNAGTKPSISDLSASMSSSQHSSDYDTPSRSGTNMLSGSSNGIPSTSWGSFFKRPTTATSDNTAGSQGDGSRTTLSLTSGSRFSTGASSSPDTGSRIPSHRSGVSGTSSPFLGNGLPASTVTTRPTSSLGAYSTSRSTPHLGSDTKSPSLSGGSSYTRPTETEGNSSSGSKFDSQGSASTTTGSPIDVNRFPSRSPGFGSSQSIMSTAVSHGNSGTSSQGSLLSNSGLPTSVGSPSITPGSNLSSGSRFDSQGIAFGTGVSHAGGRTVTRLSSGSRFGAQNGHGTRGLPTTDDRRPSVSSSGFSSSLPESRAPGHEIGSSGSQIIGSGSSTALTRKGSILNGSHGGLGSSVGSTFPENKLKGSVSSEREVPSTDASESSGSGSIISRNSFSVPSPGSPIQGSAGPLGEPYTSSGTRPSISGSKFSMPFSSNIETPSNRFRSPSGTVSQFTSVNNLPSTNNIQYQMSLGASSSERPSASQPSLTGSNANSFADPTRFSSDTSISYESGSYSSDNNNFGSSSSHGFTVRSQENIREFAGSFKEGDRPHPEIQGTESEFTFGRPGFGANRPGFNALRPSQRVFGNNFIATGTNNSPAASVYSETALGSAGGPSRAESSGNNPDSDTTGTLSLQGYGTNSRTPSQLNGSGSESRLSGGLGSSTGGSSLISRGASSQQSHSFHSTSSSIGTVQFGGTVHPGFCPSVTNVCTEPKGSLPKCVTDDSCGPTEKCCFDTCYLNPGHHFVCKEALQQREPF